MKKISLLLSILLTSTMLFGCKKKNNNDINKVSNNVVLIEEEALKAVKELIRANENKKKYDIKSESFNLNADAKYTYSGHTEDYNINLSNGQFDLEYEAISSKEFKAYAILSGDYLTSCVVDNRGVIDEEESSSFNFKLNNELLYMDDSSFYATLSNDMHKKLTDDNTQGELNIYGGYELGNIDNSDVEDTILSIFDPREYINPINLLDMITSQIIIKKYISYSKIAGAYNVKFSLEKSDIYTLISELLNSYASSISIPDDSKVNINLSFTKEKFLNLSVNINIGALLNYEGAKVEFNYNLNGVLKYDNLTPGLDEFKKSEKFIKYDEANIDYDKFINDSVDNVKFIYEQIIALF